ncbi:MAG: aminotransferase class [Solirubrobacteraceae bacterium]|nr:aminotransferase class [Solirubrobacteraceae bacterium]
MLGSLDGAIAPVQELHIPVVDEGLVRGDGVFEVVRLYDGTPFALEDHFARMERSAQTSRLPVDFAALRAEVAALLEAATPGECALRVMATRGGRRIALLQDIPPYPATAKLAVVTYAPTRILDGVKTLSYGANMLAGRLAQEQGADEALLVTPHGRVLEAPTSAFFYVRDGRLFTPPLEDHILDSITRRRILATVAVEERPTTLDDVREADEAFLASTFKEVLPIHAIVDVAEFPAPGPVSERVRAQLAEAIAAELAA